MPYLYIDHNNRIQQRSFKDAEAEAVKLLNRVEYLEKQIKRLEEERDKWSKRALEKQAIIAELEKAGIEIPKISEVSKNK